jgi:hypothetical protein
MLLVEMTITAERYVLKQGPAPAYVYAYPNYGHTYPSYGYGYGYGRPYVGNYWGHGRRVADR